MNRNTFIRSCLTKGLTLTGAMALLEGCAPGVYYAKGIFSEGKISFPKSEYIGYKKNGEVFERKFVLLTYEKLEFPICAYHLENEKYVALYLECTHQGCEVKPHDEGLVCPCHGSEFSNTGKVTGPPADDDLKTFAVFSDDQSVFIQL